MYTDIFIPIGVCRNSYSLTKNLKTREHCALSAFRVRFGVLRVVTDHGAHRLHSYHFSYTGAQYFAIVQMSVGKCFPLLFSPSSFAYMLYVRIIQLPDHFHRGARGIPTHLYSFLPGFVDFTVGFLAGVSRCSNQITYSRLGPR